MKFVFFLISILCFKIVVSQQTTWQQHVRYNINVSLLPAKKQLEGNMKIVYKNNSPDTLKSIWFHLWPNAYKDNNTAFANQLLLNGNTSFYFSSPNEKGFIDSLNFKIEDIECKTNEHAEFVDAIEVLLAEVLMPGDSVLLSTTFRVKLPALFSRSGYENNFFSVTQWYPKPAVYDVNGWNVMPYLDQGEFYSEFANYTVNINVPYQFKVAATGELVSQSYFTKENNKPQSDDSMKKYCFKADMVHDFAWFADTGFKVHQSYVVLSNNDTVFTWLYDYSKQVYDDLSDIMKPINDAVKFYSEKVGNYPYKNCTVVIGPLKAGGGMEYPTITICVWYDSRIVMHEIGHNWFQGILGSNERKHPWMDESLNSYLEGYFMGFRPDSLFLNSKKSIDWGNYQEELTYYYVSRQGRAQPLSLAADKFTNLNYGAIVYGKGPMLFAYLHHYLGDSLFFAALQNYFNLWKFKHPLPADMQHAFEQVTRSDLSWFFVDLINENNETDIVKTKRGWKLKGNQNLKYGIKTTSPLNFTGLFPETNYSNNGQRSRFVQFHFPFQLPNFNNTLHLNIMPIVGANYHDKFYAGLVISNRTIFRNRVELLAAPSYSFSMNRMIGYARINRLFAINSNKIQSLSIGLQGNSYGTSIWGINNSYYRLNPFVELIFKANNKMLESRSKMKIQYINTGLRKVGYNYSDSLGNVFEQAFPTNYFMNYFIGNYVFTNNNPIHSISVEPTVEVGFAKPSKGNLSYIKTMLNIQYKWQYMKKKYFQSSLFLGYIPSKSGSVGMQQFFVGGVNGINDYTYNTPLIGRGYSVFDNNIAARQILWQPMSIRSLLPISNNDKWIAVLNNDIQFPGILPIGIYNDMAIAPTMYYNVNAGAIAYTKPNFYNTFGVVVQLFKKNVEVFFPLAYNKIYKNTFTFSFAKSIGFRINLNKLHPFDIIDNYKY